VRGSDGENDDIVTDGESESDDSGDEGRTSAILLKKSVKKPLAGTNAELLGRGKSKPLGKKKKEIEAERVNKTRRSIEQVNGSNISNENLGEKEVTDDTLGPISSNDNCIKSYRPDTVKKKKTRSRQKNIRKDNRTDDQKPEHLRIISSGYSGHPITPETRIRLGLPDKNVKYRSPKKPKSVDRGSTDNIHGNNVLKADAFSEKKPHKMKRKRSKYKNLC